MEDSNEKQEATFVDSLLGFIMTKASAWAQAISPEVKEKIGDGAGGKGSISAIELSRSVQQAQPSSSQQHSSPQVQQSTPVLSGVGKASATVNRNLMSLIEPGSQYLELGEGGDSYILLSVQYSPPEELAEAGRLVAGYRAEIPGYKGLRYWISQQMKPYSAEQITALEERASSRGKTADPLLGELESLLTSLDGANRTIRGKFEQDLKLGKQLTPEEMSSANKIAEVSLELHDFLEANSGHFAHVRLDGLPLAENLRVAMAKNECNNEWVTKVRNALKISYSKLPAFVEVYNMLLKSGYFTNSGEL